MSGEQTLPVKNKEISSRGRYNTQRQVETQNNIDAYKTEIFEVSVEHSRKCGMFHLCWPNKQIFIIIYVISPATL